MKFLSALTVLIVFAGIYIDSSLAGIIEKTRIGIYFDFPIQLNNKQLNWLIMLHNYSTPPTANLYSDLDEKLYKAYDKRIRPHQDDGN